MSSAGQHQGTATQGCCQAHPWQTLCPITSVSFLLSQPHIPAQCPTTLLPRKGEADCSFGWNAHAPAQYQPRKLLSAPQCLTANFLLLILPGIAGKLCCGWSNSCWISHRRPLTTEVQQSDFAHQDFKEIWGTVRWRTLSMWKENYHIYFRIRYSYLQTVLKNRVCIAEWCESLAWCEVKFPWLFQGDEGFILLYLGVVEA